MDVIKGLCTLLTLCFLMEFKTADGIDKIKNLSKKQSEHAFTHTMNIVGDKFVVDGVPLRIISGSLHYFRVPAQYWRDRLRKMKAAGLNSVATYVEWSYHEPEERQYEFKGDRDVARFVRMAAEESLFVLLRPGPYICAERDLGGLPYWLLSKYPNISLRSSDMDFIYETKVWMDTLFKYLIPLLHGNGGPIILVQVENEYGSHGNEIMYMDLVSDILYHHVDNNAILYTTDGESHLYDGMVASGLPTVDFGSFDDVSLNIYKLRALLNGYGPLMNSEFYTGWMTHWGDDTMSKRGKDKLIKVLNEMLNRQMSINFYMFCGGTNFEFSSGANTNDSGHFLPQVTSYDYDAPISEAGDLTSKYYAIKDTFITFDPEMRNISYPRASPKGVYGMVSLSPRVQLLSSQGRLSLGKKYDDVTGGVLPTFERLRQRAGLVLYELTVHHGRGILEILQPRDRVYVYVDGVSKGVIDRTTKKFRIRLKIKSNSVLSLLVENQGRICFGKDLKDFKGILGSVNFNDKVLNGTWTITGYPLQTIPANLPNMLNSPTLTNGPILYGGHFILSVRQKPFDTFLNLIGWGKGYAWINGHNIGRYWPSLGPQLTLYVPGVWLMPAPAPNQIRILELEHAPDELNVEFIDYPISMHRLSMLDYPIPIPMFVPISPRVSKLLCVSSIVLYSGVSY